MNRYDYQFAATCPADGATIIYHLTIKTKAVVMAEDIVAACRFEAPVFHEALADTLFDKLGGKQKVRAVHQSVRITTVRPEKRSARNAQTGDEIA